MKKIALLNNNAFVQLSVCGSHVDRRLYVAPSSVLNVYYDEICLKFASHQLLLYVVYMCQKH